MIHGAVTGGPPTEPGGVFSLASPDVLAAAVEARRVQRVTVRTIAMEATFASAEEHFDTVSATAAPLRAALAAAHPSLAAIKATTAEIIAPFRPTPAT